MAPAVVPPATGQVSAADPPARPPEDPPAQPPADPPVDPACEPPSDNPLAERGWRYGDDVTPFIEKGPPELKAICGKCHTTPAPDVIVKGEWPRVLREMGILMEKAGTPPDNETMVRIYRHYVDSAPVEFRRIPAATVPGALEFRKEAFGSSEREVARVTNLDMADVDGDGRLEVVVCDGTANTVSLARPGPSAGTEEVIASCNAPSRTAVFDSDRDGDLDIAVACLGALSPTDNPVGSILLLVNNGPKGWERRELAAGLPRVADVQPADVDADGDTDLVVAASGFSTTGSIGWLRNDGAKWQHVKIADRPGVLRVPVTDLDADGRPDFVALVASEAESVTLYRNKGGTFEAKKVFEAGNPLYGSSGLELADLDKDGDVDILFSNGDANSDPCAMPWPYHGVSWLENRGKLDFSLHDIGRCYGPYPIAVVDLDRDGDLDVAAGVLFGMWADPNESGLVWFENDGKMTFTCHHVPSPQRFSALAAGDLDGDGVPELVSGQMTFLGTTGVKEDGLLKWSVTKKK